MSSMVENSALKGAIASADCCALFSAAFSFPGEELAQAWINGTLCVDLQDCLEELGMDSAVVSEVRLVAHAYDASPEAEKEFLGILRREHSRLFLLPGKYANIFPFESAYRHVSEGREGMPSIFVARSTKDVERRMIDFNVLPQTARQEPVDSLWGELDFLRFLYTGYAQSLIQKDLEQVDYWFGALSDFRAQHIDTWIPGLLRDVDIDSEIYRPLAQIAVAVLDATAIETNGGVE